MKNSKRIISLLLSVLLCIGLFSGCSTSPKMPTPDELLEGAFGKEAVSSLSAKLRANIDVNVDMTTAGIDGLMQMTYIMDADMAEDEKGNFSVKGDINYTILGIDGSKKLESYEIVENETRIVYDYDDQEDAWTKEELSNTEKTSELISIIDVIDIKNFEKETLIVEELPDGYTVKGVIKSSVLKDSFDILNSLIGSQSLISNDIMFDVSVKFNKESKVIESISFVMNLEDAADAIKETYKQLELDIDISEINTSVIELPSYVEESAIKPEGDIETESTDEAETP